MVKHLKLPEGTLKRVSVSVLLDQRSHWDVVANKPKLVLEPPTTAQLKSVKEIVAAVVGIDAARGDLVVVETLPFDTTLAAEPPPGLIPAPPGTSSKPNAPGTTAVEPVWRQRQFQTLAGVAAGIVSLLVAAFLVWKKRRSRRKVTVTTDRHTEALPGSGASPGPDSRQISASGNDGEDPVHKAAQAAALEAQQEREVLAGIKLPEITTKKGEVLKRHIREEIKKSPEAIAGVVRTWLHSVSE